MHFTINFRLLLCCSFFLCVFTPVSAQTASGVVEPVAYTGIPDFNRLKPSPASDLLKSLFRKTFETQKNLPDAQERANSMLNLLDLQIPTSDDDGAVKTLDALLDTCGAITNPFAQDELFAKMAFASNRLGNYEQALKLAKGISDSSLRIRMTLGVIEQQIDLDKEKAETNDSSVDHEKTLKQYLPGLREQLGFAIKDKNYAARSSACTLMGILFARADKIDESNQFFKNAIDAAEELEKIDAANAVSFILQKQAIMLMETGNEEVAMSIAESQPTQERKNIVLGGIVYYYISGETNNTEQAVSIFEKIEEIPDNATSEEFRNSVLAGVITAIGKTQDADFMIEFIEKNIESPEIKERAIAAAIVAFLQVKKSDQALKMLGIKTSLEFVDNELSRIIGWELQNQNIDQAIAVIKLVAKEDRRKALSGNVVYSMVLSGKDEEAKKFLDSLYTENEKIEIEKLVKESELLYAAAKTEGNLKELTSLFSRQLQMYDIFGARKTLLAMADAAAHIHELTPEIETLFNTGRGLIQLSAKDEGKKILTEIESKIDGIPTTDQRLKYLGQIAAMRIQMDEKEDAIQTIGRIIELAPSKAKPTDQILVLIDMIVAQIQLGGKEDAIKTIQTAEKIGDSLGSTAEKCGVYLTLGRLLLQAEAEQRN